MGNTKTSPFKINPGTEEEMSLEGYKWSWQKAIFGWLTVILTGGIILLINAWRPSILLKMTHSECRSEKADKILLKDIYRQEYVEKVHRSKSTEESLEDIYFFNKRIKYVWKKDALQYVKVSGLELESCMNFYNMSDGLTESEAQSRSSFFGKNSILIKMEPIYKLLLQEITSPFYIYQMFIVIVWLIQVYYQFTLCLIILSVISVTASVWQTRRQTKALRDTVHSESVVTLLRDGYEVKKSSKELVPGDVIILPEQQSMMECDAVLISGNCIVNESMLTGESTPITKIPLAPEGHLTYSSVTHKGSTLFCGTQVLHARPCDSPQVKAVVYRTGFNTAKGELVRTILYPVPIHLKLYRDLLKSIIIFLILGIPAMAYSGIVFTKLGAFVKDIVIIVVDVATFVVPPLLPAVLTSINAYAQRRLKKHGIFCLNSRYINFCGGLDIVCFDKTGTLTEDNLDLSGVVPAEDGEFQEPVKDLKYLPPCPLLVALATCHSLNVIDNKIVGYTLDVKMFEAIEWTLEEPRIDDATNFDRTPPRIVKPKNTGEGGLDIAIVQQFPFESLLQRMTVVITVAGTDRFQLFIKGAPETVSGLCLSQTVPENFLEVLESYTRKGLRVLAVASKDLADGTTWDEAVHMSREELEKDLSFHGLLVLQNRLKPETEPTIRKLVQADIRTVMVTGDNLLTSVTVARECGMISEQDAVIGVRAKFSEYGGNDALHLKVHYSYLKYPGFSEKLSTNQNGMIDDVTIPLLKKNSYHLAMEGATFDLIRNHDDTLFKKVVHKGTIFARMLPNDKLYLVKALQELGHQVGMCGDGANDCGALKAAHAGVSLSVAEASVASPFTSRKQNIRCLLDVIREGRATLSATFGAFRYMVGYCFTLLVGALFLFWDGQKPSDGAYVLIDIVVSLLPPMLFGSTEPYPGIVKRHPTRRISSFLPQLSMLSFIMIQIGVHCIAYYYCISQPWYEPFIFDKTKVHQPPPTDIATAVLSINCMAYVIAAVVFAPGPPYRKHFLSNRVYVSVIFLEFVIVSYITIYPADFIRNQINFKKAPDIEYHLVLYVLSLANFILSYLWEVFFIQGLLFNKVQPALRRIRGPIHLFEKIDQELLQNPKWPPIGKAELSVEDLHNSHQEDAAEEEETESRNKWFRQSSDSSANIFKRPFIARSDDRLTISKREPVTFVTFQDGTHRTVRKNEDADSQSLIDDSCV